MISGRKPEVLYLHVGLHKTATTSLQYFFYRNRRTLAKHGIHYPRTGRGRAWAHHYLASAMRTSVHPEFSPKYPLAKYIERLGQETSGNQKVLLSSEVFSEHGMPGALEQLIPLAERVQVILYLRRNDLYWESVYAQRIKMGSTLDFKTFIKPRMFNLNYWRICQRWANRFGKENLIIRPFEKKQLVGGNIMQDFLSLLDWDHDIVLKPVHRLLNVSLSRDELEFKKLLNHITQNRLLIRPLEDSSIKNRSFTLKEEFFSAFERSAILDRAEAHNTLVAQTFMDRADGLLFHPPMSQGEKADYPGLAPNEIAEIGRYIRRNHPVRYLILHHAVTKGRRAHDPKVKRAAESLSVALI